MTSPERWQQLKRCPSPFPAQVALGFATPGREQPQPQCVPRCCCSQHPRGTLSQPSPGTHSWGCEGSCWSIPRGVKPGLPQGLRASGTRAGLLHYGR